MTTRFELCVFVVAVSACNPSTTSTIIPSSPPLPPSPPSAPQSVSGTWQGPFPPSGAYTLLILHSTGDSVSGTDLEYGVLTVFSDSGDVSGRYANGDLNLAIAYHHGGAATYAAHALGSDSVVGTWSGLNGTGTLKFTRRAN